MQKFSSNDPTELKKEYQSKTNDLNDLSKSIKETIYDLQNTTTLIRLYLFHTNNDDEQSLINVMYEITTHLVEENGKKFDTHELDIFIELVRKFFDGKFFDKQMKELQNKIA